MAYGEVQLLALALFYVQDVSELNVEFSGYGGCSFEEPWQRLALFVEAGVYAEAFHFALQFLFGHADIIAFLARTATGLDLDATRRKRGWARRHKGELELPIITKRDRDSFRYNRGFVWFI